jgi:hypothetical protein
MYIPALANSEQTKHTAVDQSEYWHSLCNMQLRVQTHLLFQMIEEIENARANYASALGGDTGC